VKLVTIKKAETPGAVIRKLNKEWQKGKFLNHPAGLDATHNDDFNDNVLNPNFWQIKAGPAGSSVLEQNQRLECTLPTTGGQVGVVTLNSHDLTTCDIRVDVNNIDPIAAQCLMINLQKYVLTGDPWVATTDWYIAFKYNHSNQFRVYRKVGGVSVLLYNALWTGATGSMRMTIDAAGTIQIYEEANLRVSEAYALAQRTAVYIYLYVDTVIGGVSGMNYFDNYLHSDACPEVLGGGNPSLQAAKVILGL